MLKSLPARTKLTTLVAIAIYSFSPTSGLNAEPANILTKQLCIETQQFVTLNAPNQDARGRGRAICNNLIARYVNRAVEKQGTTNACNHAWDNLMTGGIGGKGPTPDHFCDSLMTQGIFPKQ